MPRGYIVMVGLFAGLGSFLFGYDTGIITTMFTRRLDMGNPNDAATGAIVATYIAGEAVGAIMQSVLGDKLGRKHFMQMMCLVVTVGTVIQTAAQNYSMFLVGRILTGIAVGGLVGTVPIYNSEISPPASRGLIGGLSGYMIGIGGFLANWIGFACGYASDSSSFQWRFPLALQVPPGIILFIGLQFFLPESPRWLVTKGRFDEAKISFGRVRGELMAAALEKEFDDMKEQILYEKVAIARGQVLSEAWTKYKKRVIIAIATQTMTSLTGVNVINYYQTTLYKQLGITGTRFFSWLVFMEPLASSSTLPTHGGSLLDASNSWDSPLLVFALTLYIPPIMAREFADSDNKVGKGFAILGIYLFTAIYYAGINSTTWLYGVEILPIFLRSKVTGLASTSHFVWNIALTEAGPSAFANIRENYYYVFVGTTFFSAVCIYFYFLNPGRNRAEFGDAVVHADDDDAADTTKFTKNIEKVLEQVLSVLLEKGRLWGRPTYYACAKLSLWPQTPHDTLLLR
ncbi:general substrate transporter [Hymenopellis radicata]|nr:general substrate transporter [Hymenopellis radicata]